MRTWRVAARSVDRHGPVGATHARPWISLCSNSRNSRSRRCDRRGPVGGDPPSTGGHALATRPHLDLCRIQAGERPRGGAARVDVASAHVPLRGVDPATTYALLDSARRRSLPNSSGLGKAPHGAPRRRFEYARREATAVLEARSHVDFSNTLDAVARLSVRGAGARCRSAPDAPAPRPCRRRPRADRRGVPSRTGLVRR